MSLVLAKGPSVTAFVPPENRTRLPLLLGCSPSPASMTPAFTSSSLKFPISRSSFSLGITPASEFFVALMSTITRIVHSLVREAVEPSWRRRSLSPVVAPSLSRARSGGIDRSSANVPSAVTSPLHYAAHGLLIRRVTRAPPRIEIRFQRSAEVGARDEVAMRTGKGMLDQRLRALGFSYAPIKLAKFGLRKGGP